MIIIVILLEDGIKIHKIPIFYLVLVGWDNQAERKLFIRTDVVFIIEVIELLLDEIRHLLIIAQY